MFSKLGLICIVATTCCVQLAVTQQPNAPVTRPEAYCQNIPAQWPLNINNLQGNWTLSHYYESSEYFGTAPPHPNCGSVSITTSTQGNSLNIEAYRMMDDNNHTPSTRNKVASYLHADVSPGRWVLNNSVGFFAFAGPEVSSMTILGVWPKTFTVSPDVQAFLYVTCSATGPAFNSLHVVTEVGIVHRNGGLTAESLDYFGVLLSQHSQYGLPPLNYPNRHGDVLRNVRHDCCDAGNICGSP